VRSRLDPGEERRLGELYRRHVPEMVRLAYIVTGDAAAAEDLAQDAFVRVAGRFGHLRNRDAFGLYLRRTLLNLCRNHFRRKDTERAYLRSQTLPSPIEPQSALHEHDAVRAALLRLPVRQRTAVALRYFEDLSVEETARVMGCGPKAVKSLTARGMETLRAMLEEEEVGRA
jgi:RNA polymerase sigma-70 factor (sigma-E family)